MPIELVENFDSNKSCKEILDILTEVVQIRKGKILSCSQNSLKVKFGSKIMLRLFGGIILGNYFRNQLPFEIEINIEPVENNSRISLHFFDNLGKFIIRDPWGQSIYNKHFNEFLKEVKEKL